GALGSVVAARLADAHEVCLVGRRNHVDAINERGLQITGHTEIVQTAIYATTDPSSLKGVAPDAVLLTVKAYDTRSAVAALSDYWSTSIFVSLQNGLGNEEAIAEQATKVLGAVINQGATFIGPGEVFHAGSGEIDLGPFAGTTDDDAETIAAALRDAGFPARARRDIRAKIWAKVILNAAVNPLTALLRKRTGELIGNEALEDALGLVVEESVAIAAACGVSLDATEILDKIRAVAEATRDNKSSMLQDLERGRRTEIDAINGALIARAREHGIPCPANELLANMVRAAEA
ncbi:MAG: 2-dehydropantoate 2-reductase, partial [Acidobacteria bacterium]|nr:2-dehydropantoate 2-reductase [Acidobacteriota bacterium]